MEAWITALTGGLGIALLGIIGNIILQAFLRRKIHAEAGSSIAAGADSVVESALCMVKEMRVDMAALKARVAELEAENAELKKTVAAQGELIKRLAAELTKYQARGQGVVE